MADGGDLGGVEAFGYKQELKRALGFFDLLVFGLIFIAPLAPLAIFGFVFNSSGGMVPLVYVVGMIGMLFTAISYMDMSEAFPLAGSVYTYAHRTIGRLAGFVAGWALLLDYLLVPSLLNVLTADVIHTLWPEIPKLPLVVGFIAIITLANIAGIEATARVNRVVLVLQMLVVAFLLGCGVVAVVHGVGGAHFSTAPFFRADKISPALIFGSLSIGALSFLGFDAISTLSEEAKGGARSVGRATIVSLLLVGGLFIAQTYMVSLFALNVDSFKEGDEAATAVVPIATIMGGPLLKWLTVIFAYIVVNVSNAMVAQVATARLLYSMSRDGRIPRFLAHVHAKTQTPRRAILLIAGIGTTIAVLLVERADLLTSLVNFGALSGFMILHISVLTHFAWRQRSGKWFRHWLSPLCGLAIIFYVLYNAEPEAKIAGAVWMALGLAGLFAAKLLRSRKTALSSAGNISTTEK
jgi:amino acid transporter